MRIRSAGATALYLSLLLTSLVEAAGHELLCRDDPARQEAGSARATTEVQIAPGESDLGDDCGYCGLCGQRLSLSPASTTDPTFVVAGVQATGRTTFLIKSESASQLSRGPPPR